MSLVSEYMELQLRAAQQEAIQQDFSAFLHQSVQTLNPQAEYLHNWHHDLLGEYLAAVESGTLPRLMINMPPRYLKSLCVSVAWPAWLLGQNSARRIIVASYAASLSLKHSLDCRALLESEWFQHSFPQTRLMQGQNEKHKYLTTKHGFRLATSVGGSVTGEGGDVLIVDDPLNPAQAESKIFRNLANRWFEQTFSTRLNDKKRGSIVVVMQRLHPQDLSGFLQQKSGWEVLELPAIASRTLHFITTHFHHRYLREATLHTEREDLPTLQKLQHEMGSHAFGAQYLQQPQSREGGMVKPLWLKRYGKDFDFTLDNVDVDTTAQGAAHSGGVWGVSPQRTKCINIYQSWDTAIKAGAQNDPSVCLTFAYHENQHYLLEVLRERLEYPQLRKAILTQAERWNPRAVLIEDKASGQSLLQDLRQNTQLPVIPQLPQQDKITRFAAITPQIEAGRLLLPHHAHWLPTFESELLSFPDTPHDDQIDALSQYFHWHLKREKAGNMQVRRI